MAEPQDPHAHDPPRRYAPGEAANPHFRKLLNQVRFLGLKSSLVDYANGVAVSRQEVPGAVSGLGNVIDGTCRFAILSEAGLPFWAIPRPDIDSPEKELAFLVASDQKSDRDPLEKAACVRAWLAATGSTQKEACARFGFSEWGLCRLLKAMEMPGQVLAALEAGDLSLAHLAQLRRVKDPAAMAGLARRAAEQGLSVQDLRSAARPPRRGPRRRMVTRNSGGVVLSYPEDISIKDCVEAIQTLRRQIEERKKGIDKDALAVSVLEARP